MRTCGSRTAARRLRLRPSALRAGATTILAFTVMCAAGAGAGQAAVPSCPQIAQFNAGNFTNPTTITNTTFPLVPGAQLTLEGTVVRGGVTVPHRVVFTVTDVTKVINGVRTLVIWDVDSEGGVVIESELAFFAQDDAGNVWNLGEYPEEFLDGTFVGAPSVWIAGIREAQAGIHMVPVPKVSGTFFLQGFAPAIEFEDCGRVAKIGQRTTVPFGSFDNVVVTEEKDAFDPAGGIQTKFYAPGVGIVRIGAINDPQAETLALTNSARLSGDALENARVEALKLDERGYQNSDVYIQTPRAERPPGTGPPPPPPPPPAAQPATAPVVLSAVTRNRLTARAARGIIRRAVRARLRNWSVTRVSCKLTVGGAARCTFSAKRRGVRLRGSGTVRRLTSGRVRYRLTTRVTRNGCHPVQSRRCSRTSIWTR
jgi:hypothetical protein